jgi:hypothetical protein
MFCTAYAQILNIYIGLPAGSAAFKQITPNVSDERIPDAYFFIPRVSCLVLCGPVWSCVVLCGPVWSCVVLCGPVWSCVVLCGPVWSCVVLCGPVWSCAVIWAMWSCVIMGVMCGHCGHV